MRAAPNFSRSAWSPPGPLGERSSASWCSTTRHRIAIAAGAARELGRLSAGLSRATRAQCGRFGPTNPLRMVCMGRRVSSSALLAELRHGGQLGQTPDAVAPRSPLARAQILHTTGSPHTHTLGARLGAPLCTDSDTSQWSPPRLTALQSPPNRYVRPCQGWLVPRPNQHLREGVEDVECRAL